MLTSSKQLPNSSDHRTLMDNQIKKKLYSIKKTSPETPHLLRSSDSNVVRIPKCARCRNHGIDCDLKGHKEKCSFKECSCQSCLVVLERQKVTATRVAHLRKQRKLAITIGTKKPAYEQRNPLTEEEEFILSKPLHNRTSEDSNYSRCSNLKYNNGYQYHVEVPSPLSKLNSSNLLREAQNAYSYFYGRSYYPNSKEDDRLNFDNTSSIKKKKHFFNGCSHSDQRNSPCKSTKSVVLMEENDEYETSYQQYSRAAFSSHLDRLNISKYYTEALKSKLTDSVRSPIDTLEKLNHGAIVSKEIKSTKYLDQQIKQSTFAPCRGESSIGQVETKRLEVLLIMFPEIHEEKLKEVLLENKSDVQCAVESLLQLRKEPEGLRSHRHKSSDRVLKCVRYQRDRYNQ